MTDDRLQIALDALRRIEAWTRAYPVMVWPELTKEEWRDVASALKALKLPSIDRISASNMRHVLNELSKEVSDVLDEIKRRTIATTEVEE